MLIGYSDKGTHIIAKWFEHFELDAGAVRVS
jgi:hypothetical protein